jgi:hypothetical protein
MLADERSAREAMEKLREPAAEGRMLVADLIASVTTSTTWPSPAPSTPADWFNRRRDRPADPVGRAILVLPTWLARKKGLRRR